MLDRKAKEERRLTGAEDYALRMKRIRRGIAALNAATQAAREGRTSGQERRKDKIVAHVATCRACPFVFSSADWREANRAAGAHRLGKCGGAR